MHSHLASLVLPLLLAFVPAAAGPNPSATDVAKELKTYYEDGKKVPAYEAALKKLAADDASQRKASAAWLRALLAQALKDEKSGAAPWRATPYWGSSGENPARNLRRDIARALAEAQPLPGAVPVLRWFFEEEVLPNLQEDAATALGKVKGQEAAALRAELATRPHPNLVVVVAVLKQIAAEKGKLPDDKLRALCHHHRASVREAARALNQQQGNPDPGPFDPVQAMRSPAVKKLMKDVEKLLIDMPPADAPFIVATITLFNKDKKKDHVYSERGWLLKEKGDTLEIVTPYGWKETLRKSAELTRDEGDKYWWTCAITRGKIEDEVGRVEKIRKEGDKDFEFSERGGLTGQFQGRGAGLYETLLAQRLYVAGKEALAARVLFPALETLYRDDAMVDIVRREMGRIYGYQMLTAFVGDRDYERAEKLAKTLAQHYPEAIFHHYAVQLAVELPKRRDDFVKLKLPTPAEWKEMKKKLTRVQQIDFLCERMRLLNCFQMGFPSGYYEDQTQYAEPCGLSRNAAWGKRQGKTVVINPWSELLGPINWHGEDKARPKGMELTIKDVPQLSKFLRDDWFMLIVSFVREFHTDRGLSSTRPEFARIINGLACKDLCKIDGWDKLSPAQIDKEIERISRWAKENAHKTPVQLEWEALEDVLASGGGWNAVERRVDWLLKQKQTKAYDVLKRFLESEKTDPSEKSRVLQVYLRHDVNKAKDLAPKYLNHKNDSLRFEAALIVFQTGEKAKAREVLGKVLETEVIDLGLQSIVELLLKDGSDASRRQIARLFANKNLHSANSTARYERSNILRRCADAGMTEPYRYYLKQLDDNEVAYSSSSSGDTEVRRVTFAEAAAEEIVEDFARDDPDVKKIAKKFPKTADQIPHLKKWLQTRIAKQKKTPEEVRTAIEKALPLLKKGAEGHIAQRTCFACHNQALPMLAFTTARTRGFAASEEDLKKQLQFIAAFLKENEKNYRKGKGQGGQVDTAGYALFTLELGGWKPDTTTEAVVEYLLLRDKDLDHWRTTSNRPPSEVSAFTATYLAIRALQTWGTDGQKERIAKRIGAARSWLLRTKAKDTEDRVFRLWALRAVDAPEKDLQLAAEELIQSQRKDGGWGQTSAMDSDAYATGSALVALHEAGKLASSDPVYRRGVVFLLKSQQQDGSWLVRSRSKPFQKYYESGFPHRKDQFISIAASGWAATALALACPPVDIQP
jgi:hypothetical protein